MKLSRKEFLKTLAVLGAAAPLSGCERITTELTHRFGGELPDKIEPLTGHHIDPMFHLLSRAGFGPAPGDLEAAKKLGRAGWLQQQLNPDTIDDGTCMFRAKRFETLELDAGTCYEFKKPIIRDELVRHAVIRAVYSKRQLLEAMVEFWNDHLNIYIEKGDCMYLKSSDERLVVRAHALGKFSDLIRGSATSPAMLVYLDGNANKVEGKHGIPNENYARELLELHTMGVHGGYTQNDVYEIGRCLTGWTLHTPWQRAKVYFNAEHHDDGEKHVLGHTIPAGGGEADVDRVIKIVCGHPSTAKYIATKLVTRFVADDPPTTLVNNVASCFSTTSGDIKAMLKTMFESEEFDANRGTKFKRPFRYVVTSLRLAGADTFAHTPLLEYLTRMGHAPFQYPTPDGYPEDAAHWASSLLWRWNFALSLASNKIEGVSSRFDDVAKALLVSGNGINARDGVARRGGAEHDRERGDAIANNAAAQRALSNNIGRQSKASRQKHMPTSELETLFAYLVGRRPGQTEIDCLKPFAGTVSGAAANAELIGLIMSCPAFQRF